MRKEQAIGLHLVAALLVGVGPAAPMTADHLEIDSSQPYVTLLLNGSPVRLRVELDSPGTVTLNPAAARRTGLARSRPVTMNVGPVSIPGRYSNASIRMNERSMLVRVDWYARDVAGDADGTVTPALLPYERITIRYGKAAASSRRVSFKTEMNHQVGIHSRIRVGNHRLRFRFAPDRETIATSAAASILVASQGAAWEGPVLRLPIAFGVERPVRSLTLLRPFALGEIHLERMFARLADFAGKHDLPAFTTPVRPDEIVVTGKRERQRPVYRITIGRPSLSGCWSATYFRSSGDLALTCSEMG